MPKASYNIFDGLNVGYGRRTVDDNIGGESAGVNQMKCVVLKVTDMTTLVTDPTALSLNASGGYSMSAQIPGGATIQEVWITTDTAATSGGAADLLVGTFTVSNTTGLLVAVDADGLAAAGDSALSDFSVAGETMVLGKAAGAAQLGKTLANAADSATPVVVAASYVTAAYTAGAVTIRVFYTL